MISLPLPNNSNTNGSVKMSVENVCSTLFYYLLPSLMCGERSGAKLAAVHHPGGCYTVGGG
uniref:Uncharacterized protein n=1 Tax=Anguilla anguilla TaxID=7936 RepID=A0A0E9VK35_ANGAN